MIEKSILDEDEVSDKMKSTNIFDSDFTSYVRYVDSQIDSRVVKIKADSRFQSLTCQQISQSEHQPPPKTASRKSRDLTPTFRPQIQFPPQPSNSPSAQSPQLVAAAPLTKSVVQTMPLSPESVRPIPTSQTPPPLSPQAFLPTTLISTSPKHLDSSSQLISPSHSNHLLEGNSFTRQTLEEPQLLPPIQYILDTHVSSRTMISSAPQTIIDDIVQPPSKQIIPDETLPSSPNKSVIDGILSPHLIQPIVDEILQSPSSEFILDEIISLSSTKPIADEIIPPLSIQPIIDEILQSPSKELIIDRKLQHSSIQPIEDDKPPSNKEDALSIPSIQSIINRVPSTSILPMIVEILPSSNQFISEATLPLPKNQTNNDETLPTSSNQPIIDESVAPSPLHPMMETSISMSRLLDNRIASDIYIPCSTKKFSPAPSVDQLSCDSVVEVVEVVEPQLPSGTDDIVTVDPKSRSDRDFNGSPPTVGQCDDTDDWSFLDNGYYITPFLLLTYCAIVRKPTDEV